MIDTKLIQEIESFILNYWLETGSEPSVLMVATRFGVTEADVDTFVIHDEDDEYPDNDDRTCPECGGSGGDRWNDGVVPCKVCHGAGFIS